MWKGFAEEKNMGGVAALVKSEVETL